MWVSSLTNDTACFAMPGVTGTSNNANPKRSLHPWVILSFSQSGACKMRKERRAKQSGRLDREVKRQAGLT